MFGFQCKKCGSDKIYAKPQGRSMGIYCAACQAFIAQTTYRRMREIYDELDEKDLNDNLSLRKIRKRIVLGKKITTMRCSKCGCLLYSSVFPKVEGQFDLVNASYCPQCGRELI
jgi:predicted RNA-binding Zn-ribbon protein involved in translation (DUF1610 family)